ncbi:MAG: ATP-binding protein [Humibacillus sp.]
MAGIGLLHAVDLLVGAIVIGAGLASAQFGRVARLMLLVGATWLVGSVLPAAVFLHRGPLVHLHLTYPTGRSRRGYVTVVIGAAYVLGVVEAFVPTAALTLALALLVAAAAIDVFVRTTGPARKAGRPALWAALAFSAVLVTSALNQLLAWDIDQLVLLAYDGVVGGAAVVLTADLRWGRWTESTLSDLVADLGATSDTSGLTGQLRRALGDPGLTVGYWIAETAAYADDRGAPIELPAEDGNLTATRIDDEGRPVAVLVHDRALLEDPRLVSGVATAARLAMTNAQMLAAIRSRVGELTQSRQRIVEAAGDERARVADELANGAQRRLARVADLLDRVAVAGLSGDRNLTLVRAEVVRAREDLTTFVQGVRPAALVEGGLDAAVRDMAGHLPFRVDVRADVGRFPDAIEGALLFFCSEAVTNVAKHARATRCRVTITTEPGRIVAVVDDDGVGGADPSGSGLLGLMDRIETMGGRLVVTSALHGGTRITAIIPRPGHDAEHRGCDTNVISDSE